MPHRCGRLTASARACPPAAAHGRGAGVSDRIGQTHACTRRPDARTRLCGGLHMAAHALATEAEQLTRLTEGILKKPEVP